MQNLNLNICSQTHLVQSRVHAEKYGLKSPKRFTQKIFNVEFTDIKYVDSIFEFRNVF